MFSITLKRSAATLGVVAGLLAAAAPASAQVMPGVIGVTNRDSAGHTILMTAGTADDNMLLTGSKAPTTPTANGFGLSFEHIDMNARSNAGPAGKTIGEDSWTESAWHQTVVEGLAARSAKAEGTQVGSEGVKAPTAGTQVNNAGWILPETALRSAASA